MTRSIWRTMVSGVLLAGPAVAAAADVQALVEPCAACHGPTGAADNPAYPIIAGQYTTYLEHTLKQYRDGVRKNPIMAGMAAKLSDGDIEAIARHYSSQASPLYTPDLGGNQ